MIHYVYQSLFVKYSAENMTSCLLSFESQALMLSRKVRKVPALLILAAVHDRPTLRSTFIGMATVDFSVEDHNIVHPCH